MYNLLKKIIPKSIRNKLKITLIPKESIRRLLNNQVINEIEYSRIYDITEEDLLFNENLLANKDNSSIKNIIWLIPNFTHPFGGIFTLLRVGSFLMRYNYNVKFVFFNRNAEISKDTIEQIQTYFKNIDLDNFLAAESEKDIPDSDLVISTMWTSCYFSLKIRNTKHKAYFIQDYESIFYPSGTIYWLAESTYYFPFHRIVNSKGLFDFIQEEHQNTNIKSMYFTPGVDDRYIYNEKSLADEKIKIFFYARPSNPRNGFGLGINILKELKNIYKEKLGIILAGKPFDFNSYGIDPKFAASIQFKGIVPYQDLPEFYNQFHLSLSFMFTKHPSYIPIEMMKSGVLVVTNYNSANTWLFKDMENCLVEFPNVNRLVNKITKIIDNPDLYMKIKKNAYNLVKNFKWDDELIKIKKFIENLPRK
jgi:glycosyltransferase involved in cell wall biosynthesis